MYVCIMYDDVDDDVTMMSECLTLTETVCQLTKTALTHATVLTLHHFILLPTQCNRDVCSTRISSYGTVTKKDSTYNFVVSGK